MKKLLLIFIGIIFLVGCDAPGTSNPNNFDRGSVKVKAVEYSDIALTYINTVKNHVKNGAIAIFGDDSIYMIPVGDENTFACSGIEDVAPFGFAHKYAYVGVVKQGKVFTYYFVSRDEDGNGYNLNSEKIIRAGKGKEVVNGKALADYKVLAETYKQKGAHRDSYKSIDIDKFDKTGAFAEALGKASKVTKVKIYYYNVCKDKT